MRYIAIQPVGRHLGPYDSPGTIAQVILDGAHAINDLHKLSMLHCDISSSNVLVDDDNRGLLIDFGSALNVSNGGTDMRRTGTILFSAFSVLWGEPNTVSSELESLFHTLLYIVLDGEVRGNAPGSKLVVRDAHELLGCVILERLQKALSYDAAPAPTLTKNYLR